MPLAANAWRLTLKKPNQLRSAIYNALYAYANYLDRYGLIWLDRYGLIWDLTFRRLTFRP
jgi:hypothetical protein